MHFCWVVWANHLVLSVIILHHKATHHKTRMHSSRMRTVQVHPPLGGTWSRVYLVRGVPGPGGCTWSQGYTWSWGDVPGPGGGVPGPGGYLPRYSPRGQTDKCKNITFATSLRTVTRMFNVKFFL